MKLWLKIIIIIAVLALVGGGIFGIVKLVDQGKFDTKKISNLAYGIGGLDGQGKYMNTDRSIYTKDAFECQGLNCTLAFDNDISYQIYFYDQNNDFVHTTGSLTGAFVQDSVPFFAKYARIVITPNDDNKVSMLEVMKYAKQLKTTVYREQGFKNYTENLVVIDQMPATMNSSGAVVVSEHEHEFVSAYINISSYKEAMVLGIPAGYSSFYVYLYDNTKTYIDRINVLSDSQLTFVSSEGITYYSINLHSFDNTNFVRVVSSEVNPVTFCCR